jgi:hypothetical protein
MSESEQKPRIDKKGAGGEIAKKLSKMRCKRLSQKILNIGGEIRERERLIKKIKIMSLYLRMWRIRDAV